MDPPENVNMGRIRAPGQRASRFEPHMVLCVWPLSFALLIGWDDDDGCATCMCSQRDVCLLLLCNTEDARLNRACDSWVRHRETPVLGIASRSISTRLDISIFLEMPASLRQPSLFNTVLISALVWLANTLFYAGLTVRAKGSNRDCFF